MRDFVSATVEGDSDLKFVLEEVMRSIHIERDLIELANFGV